MENNPDQDSKGAMLAFFWLLVGLAPILIYLVVFAPDSPHPKWLNPMFLFVFCALCNLFGGFGCVREVKNEAARVLLGLFLGAFFFVLSWVVAVFQACSHMGGI